MLVRRGVGVVIALVVLAGAAVAQQRRTYIVAVAVDSTDGRVRQWAPELRKQAADVVEKAAPNVRTFIATGSKAEAAEQARKNSADYLLWIELAPRSTASVQIAGPPTPAQDPNIYGEPRANAEGDVFLSWTVEPLNGQKLRLHDARTVTPAEYPVGPRFDWLHVIASRSVRDAAAAAVGKLKKKKGIQP